LKRRLLICLPVAAMLGACASEPAAQPPAVRTGRAPPMTTEERVQRARWLARHWDELRPAQQQRVERRMRRFRPPLAATREEARLRWDSMGLEERADLVFGRPAGRRARPRPEPAPAAEVDGA
jgi:hypothetical protein